MLPRGTRPDRCPAIVLRFWIELAAVTDGPLFRPVSKGNRPPPRRLTAGAVNSLVAQAAARAGLGPNDPDTPDPTPLTQHP